MKCILENSHVRSRSRSHIIQLNTHLYVLCGSGVYSKGQVPSSQSLYMYTIITQGMCINEVMNFCGNVVLMSISAHPPVYLDKTPTRTQSTTSGMLSSVGEPG